MGSPNKASTAGLFQKIGDISSKGTGSPEFQVALFNQRVAHLNKHLFANKKDNAARFGLIKLASKSKKMLRYLQKEDVERYRNLLKQLNIRK